LGRRKRTKTREPGDLPCAVVLRELRGVRVRRGGELHSHQFDFGRRFAQRQQGSRRRSAAELFAGRHAPIRRQRTAGAVRRHQYGAPGRALFGGIRTKL